jgi:NRAMP (natural resistance-associated macrophage protein)-like metal ion transporter
VNHIQNPPPTPGTADITDPAPASDLRWWRKLGPGLITGAADDDPSGIATYSQAGAQFGLSMLWTVLLTYPFMVAIQMVSALIGRVSGHGLASNIRKNFPPLILHAIVLMLLVANTINIAADIAAMAEALKLLVGGSSHWYAIGFGAVSLGLQIWVPYHRYVSALKWLTLALFAYVITGFIVDTPWRQVLSQTFAPHLSWHAAYVTTVVAVFGTTISPYMFFWQASQEVEDTRADPMAEALRFVPSQRALNYRRISIDTFIGMGFSNIVAYFIILTTAVTLHVHGVTDIQTSAQAASALRPIAGEFAFLLFAVGIIGTGMLAIPVLAGSAAYAMAGAFRWRNSLEMKPHRAKRFYATIAISTVLGIALCFTPIDPIKALFWSAVINGVISVPIMVIMMLMAHQPKIMGPFVVTGTLRIMGWLATGVMASAVIAMFCVLG